MARHRTAKLAALVAMAGLVVGLAVAGATDSLPPQASDTARSAVTTNPATTAPGHPTEPDAAGTLDQPSDTNAVGPDATGPAKFGLCTAYFAGQGVANGGKGDAVAFLNLATAAGGVENIAKFCEDVTPAGRPRPAAAPSGTPGKPDSVGGPQGKPTSNPASQDHGPPPNAQKGLSHKP
jgi:hypothetical protein